MVDRVTQRLDGVLVRLMFSLTGREGLERRLRLVGRYYLHFAPPVVAVGTAVGVLLALLSVGVPAEIAVVVCVVGGVVVYVALRLAFRSFRRWL